MEYIDPQSGELVDLTTVLGMQKALRLLGYDPGTADGKNGPHTAGALKKFQKAAGVTADGIMGPNTHKKLVEAVSLKLAGG